MLALTQFTVILDFMVMSPLGDMLMKSLNLKPAAFGVAVSAYAFSAGLSGLLSRFDDGLDTKVAASGDAMSLGQKQLVAFIRAALREPDLLILDEATANIDTVTEQLLDTILDNLPATTTKVIIAHRLNTIKDADEIYFVNAGTVTRAGSMQNAVEMLMQGRMVS